MNSDLYLDLMKNPIKFKKNDKKYNDLDNLYYSLKKKFPNHNITIGNYELILKKIEDYLNSIIIEDVIENIINQVDESINFSSFQSYFEEEDY